MGIYLIKYPMNLKSHLAHGHNFTNKKLEVGVILP